jgi:hypothetical protein
MRMAMSPLRMPLSWASDGSAVSTLLMRQRRL